MGRNERPHFQDRRILGTSEPIRAVVQLLEQVADSSASVLINVERGTHKELAAQLIQSAGPTINLFFLRLPSWYDPANRKSRKIPQFWKIWQNRIRFCLQVSSSISRLGDR